MRCYYRLRWSRRYTITENIDNTFERSRRSAGICAAVPRNMRFALYFPGVFDSGSAQIQETPENCVKSLIFGGFLLRRENVRRIGMLA